MNDLCDSGIGRRKAPEGWSTLPLLRGICAAFETCPARQTEITRDGKVVASEKGSQKAPDAGTILSIEDPALGDTQVYRSHQESVGDDVRRL
jgi:hypothetical protein